MKLYKYTTIDTALKIMKYERILLNNASSFNDPFDSETYKVDDNEKMNELLKNYIYFSSFDEIINMVKKEKSKKLKLIINLCRFEIKCAKKLYSLNKTYKKIPLINYFINKYFKNVFENEKINDEYKKLIDEVNSIQDEIDKNTYITCFSEKYDSILMWSHYGDSHKGACIEFEIQDDKEFKKVKYSTKRPVVSNCKVLSLALGYKLSKDNNNENENELNKRFFTKSKEW
ncbi:MAG: DUF2971 domain-containing protein, partial [Erysipelotrichaceae bacterium]|nr:DUF2971 domain-containing protein [Erysipelotrichaceae bacterium]